MKQLAICLALAALLALAAIPPALAMKAVDAGSSQDADTNQKKQQKKQKAQPSAGIIRTEDGKAYTVPKAKDGYEKDKGEDGGKRQ